MTFTCFFFPCRKTNANHMQSDTFNRRAQPCVYTTLEDTQLICIVSASIMSLASAHLLPRNSDLDPVFFARLFVSALSAHALTSTCERSANFFFSSVFCFLAFAIAKKSSVSSSEGGLSDCVARNRISLRPNFAFVAIDEPWELAIYTYWRLLLHG